MILRWLVRCWLFSVFVVSFVVVVVASRIGWISGQNRHLSHAAGCWWHACGSNAGGSFVALHAQTLRRCLTTSHNISRPDISRLDASGRAAITSTDYFTYGVCTTVYCQPLVSRRMTFHTPRTMHNCTHITDGPVVLELTPPHHLACSMCCYLCCWRCVGNCAPEKR